MGQKVSSICFTLTMLIAAGRIATYRLLERVKNHCDLKSWLLCDQLFKFTLKTLLSMKLLRDFLCTPVFFLYQVFNSTFIVFCIWGQVSRQTITSNTEYLINRIFNSLKLYLCVQLHTLHSNPVKRIFSGTQVSTFYWETVGLSTYTFSANPVCMP